MPERVVWVVDVRVQEGPRIGQSDTLEIEAYDKIAVTVEPDDSYHEIQLQPGAPSQIRLLLITANNYSPDLLYGINGAPADDAAAVRLDGLQLFMGTGAVGLLGGDPPRSIHVKNQTGESVDLEILVGRDATP